MGFSYRHRGCVRRSRGVRSVDADGREERHPHVRSDRLEDAIRVGAYG